MKRDVDRISDAMHWIQYSDYAVSPAMKQAYK